MKDSKGTDVYQVHDDSLTPRPEVTVKPPDP